MLITQQPTVTTPRRKVLITALRDNMTLAAGKELANHYSPLSFEITNSDREAEIVLYLEDGYLSLIDLPLLLRRVRVAPSALHFMFSESDWPYPILPGAYPSLDKTCPWAQSWCYLPRLRTHSNVDIPWSETTFLFSFLGRVPTHPVRKLLLLLDGDSSPCLDVSGAPQRITNFDYSKSYWTLLHHSKFVLCPRGFGASSIRIFEAMSAGRAPVIISDHWQRTPGIPWNDFCVFVPESDVLRIPTILRELEGDGQRMGQLARDTFQKFFAPRVFFDKLLDTMVAQYSGFNFRTECSLLRAWHALGWREIWTLFGQAKVFAIGTLNRF
jgi:Exostosin family